MCDPTPLDDTTTVQLGRHGHGLDDPHRDEREHAARAGDTSQHRRVILAAAMGADAGITGEHAERPAVLDAGKIAGLVDGRADLSRPLRAVAKAARLHERGRDADDERARAAHAGGARQVAGEHDVGADARHAESFSPVSTRPPRRSGASRGTGRTDPRAQIRPSSPRWRRRL